MALTMPRVIATPLLTLAIVIVYASNVDWQQLALRPDKRNELWRPVTCIFVHADVAHLVTNAVALVLVGGVLEFIHGPLRILFLFFYTGIGAAFCYGWYRASSLAETPLPVWGLLGASGAIYGLIGAHAAHLALNWGETKWMRVPWIFGVALYATVDVILFVTDPVERVAYTAHVMGAVLGLLGGFFVLRNQVVLSCETTLRRLAIVTSLLIYLASVLGFFLS